MQPIVPGGDEKRRLRSWELIAWGIAAVISMERNEENGKKLQQAGEEYTHGGVKKTKFEPKVPARRLKKLSAAVKSELGEEVAVEEVIPKELQRLLQQVESDGRGRDRPHQRTSRVAFGFTGYESRTLESSSGFQRAGGGKAGSGGGGGVTGVGGGSGNCSQSGGSVGGNGIVRRVVEKQEFMQADGMLVAKEGEVRESLEVFDHEKYYPVTLPLRKPLEGDARLLDEDIEGEWEDVQEEDESGVEAARELGLTESRDEDSLFFIQFPKGLPLYLKPSGKEEKASSARSVKLEDLRKGGAIGKLLVYESGVVKLKIGDVILDALPGTECTFAQEVAAVNTTTKYCAFVGEVHKRVILTPDIADVLPDLTDLRSKP